MNPSDLSFVLQGPVPVAEKRRFAATVSDIRRLAPGCEIVVSTWADCVANVQVGADAVVVPDDPGGLHSIRSDGLELNNVNRQIVSTRAGMQAVTRPYAVKMRVDSQLTKLGFLPLYERHAAAEPDRIVVCQFFTIDPRLFEQVPFHISDWFQFGRTDVLQAFWDVPLMTVEDAVYYGNHPYAAHSTFLDRKFYCRLATEQHLSAHYAAKLGLATPRFHNDIRPEVMASHDRFVTERLIIADLDMIGLVFPKYQWVLDSSFQKLNCLGYVDWLEAVAQVRSIDLTEDQSREIARRRRRKARSRFLYWSARPFWPLLANKAAKRTVNRVLRSLLVR